MQQNQQYSRVAKGESQMFVKGVSVQITCEPSPYPWGPATNLLYTGRAMVLCDHGISYDQMVALIKMRCWDEPRSKN